MSKKTDRIIYTTGTWASAAAKAAVISFFESSLKTVDVVIPSGQRVVLPVVWARKGKACVKKEGFLEDDITCGLSIIAEAVPCDKGVILEAGEGIGVVTKKGLKLRMGEPAINPVPRFYLLKNISEVMKKYNVSSGYKIIISVPKGKRIAENTINEKLGIVGGISILGTKGIVIPFNTKSFLDSIITEIHFAKAQNLEEIVFSPGRETLDVARKKLANLPEEAFVVIGDYIYFALFHAKKAGFKRIYFFSQPAKLAKVAYGFRNTHVKYGRVSFEWLAEFFDEPVITNFNTVREVYEYLNPEKWRRLEELAEKRLSRITGLNVKVYTVFV